MALDFGRTRMVKGRGLLVRLPLIERVWTARGAKQAIVKVTGFSRGVKGLRDHLNYISRGGSLSLEKDSGEVLEGQEMQRELVSDWSADFDTRKNSRDTANIVFSMPPGSSLKALRGAVRMVGAEYFAGHEWVFAIHEDRKHPHAHMSVKMRGWEKGEKLRLRKADLYRLREKFAEASRKHGVPLAASSRAARGIGRKGVRQVEHRLRAKGVAPQVQKQAVEELAQELKRGDLQEKPWEKAMRLRHALEKKAYLEEAAKARAEAARADAHGKELFLKAAKDLEQFAKTMPDPKTRRMTWLDRLRKSTTPKKQLPDRDKGHDMELDL